MKKALVILLTFVLLASTLTACECKHEITEVPAKTATCTEDGATAGTYCTKCGEYIIKPEVIPAKGHTIVNVAAKDATCTEDGTTAGTFCSVCNDYVEKPEVIVAKGHTVVDIPAKDVTCTENGHTGGTECSVCHTVLSGSEIKAKGHQYAVTAETATCEKDGAKVFTCSVCGDSYEEALAKKAHTFSAATCDKPKTCTVCGKTEGSALGHKYSKGKCTRCGKVGEANISIPSVPQTISYSLSSGRVYSRCQVTAISKPKFLICTNDGLWYHIDLTVKCLYNYDLFGSAQQRVGYILYDSNNKIVTSGKVRSAAIPIGETANIQLELNGLEAGNYRLVLVNVLNV